MSLDKIQLPIQLIPELYNNSLVVLDVEQPKAKSINEDIFHFLGGNQKNILILVENDQAVHLPDDDLQFLTGILNACGLSFADISIVNIFQKEQQSLEMLLHFFKPKTVLTFGINWQILNADFNLASYQIIVHNGVNFITANSLQVLSKNIEEKKNLWNCLKQLFIKK